MKNNLKDLVRKNIQELAPYSSARTEYSGNEGVFLDANENPFGTYNRYPDSLQTKLKQRLADLKNIRTDKIFLGNGSDEVIDLALRIFCEPNMDKALCFSPTYGMYEVSANIHAVELIKLELNTEFQIDLANLKPFLDDTRLKLIFICSPNNPTGNLLKTKDIEYILKNFKGMVILDEAYIDFSIQDSFIEKIELYPNLIIIQTLSKAWGLAGVRLGIGFMNRDILSYFNKVKAPYNISTVNQEVALAALDKVEEYQNNIITILQEKEKLIHELRSLKIILKIFPSDANFLLIEVEEAEILYSKLINQKIIIRNRNAILKNCVRISIGNSEENRKLIAALKLINND